MTRTTDVVQDPVTYPGGRSTPPVFRTETTGVQISVASTASAATALTSGSRTVVIRCSQATYVKFGDNTVAATQGNDSFLVAAGTEIMPVPLDPTGAPYTHVSVIRLATDGVIQFFKVI